MSGINTQFNGHTAGPWQHDQGGWITTDPEDLFIGSVGSTRGKEPDMANARLVAAAPSLLAEAIRLREALDAATKWRPIATAPKDGTAVLALLDGSNVAHPVRWLDAGNKFAKGVAGWHVVWDLTPIAAHDGPIYWMPIPDAPAAHDGCAV